MFVLKVKNVRTYFQSDHSIGGGVSINDYEYAIQLLKNMVNTLCTLVNLTGKFRKEVVTRARK